VIEQYSDAGISGAKGRDGRPGLDHRSTRPHRQASSCFRFAARLPSLSAA
jgi:hypothetical protein